MALHTRRVITTVEDISGSRASNPGRRHSPAPRPFTISRSNLPSSKPRGVSSASLARGSIRRPGIADKGPGHTKTRLLSNQADPSARTFLSDQDHKKGPFEKSNVAAPEYHQSVSSGHDLALAPLSVSDVHGSDASPLLDSVAKDDDKKVDQTETLENAIKDGTEKDDQTEMSESFSHANEVSDTDFELKRGSGNTESYYNGQSDSDDNQHLDDEKDAVGARGPHQKRPKVSKEQRLRSMASYAKSQGIDLMKRIQEQMRCQEEEEQQPVDIAKAELDEMKKILQEQRRSSKEDVVPSETEMDSSPETHKTMYCRSERHYHKDSIDSETHPVSFIKIESPLEVLDWLKAMDDNKNHRIAVSENRTLSLLQAIKEGSLSSARGCSPGLQDDFEPMERLKKAERRSNFAERQIQEFEGLLDGAEDGRSDEQLRSVFSRSKTMERHFHHLRKFADDRHSELKKFYSSQDKDGIKSWRPYTGALPEKIRRDFQEHEHHKKRLGQVHSVYNDLLKFLRVEHSKRVEAESRSQHLTSQIKRQTVALRKAEKLIKQSALAPLMGNVINVIRPEARRFSPAPSGTYTPRMDNYLLHPSKEAEGDQFVPLDCASNGMTKLQRVNTPRRSNMSKTPSPHEPITKLHTYNTSLDKALYKDSSPDPGARLSNSDLIALHNRKEFEELERAVVEEGKSRGLADVDLYSEKTTVGREETSWEYRYVHLDFLKAEQPRSASPSTGQGWETLDLQSLGNLALSKRTASPSRSEGAIFEERLSSSSPNVGSLKSLSTTDHGLRQIHHLETKTDKNCYLTHREHGPSSSGGTHRMGAKEQTIKRTQKQLEMDQRIQSLPANVSESLHGEMCQGPDIKVRNLRTHVSVSAFEDESWEDASHDTLYEVLEDVASEEEPIKAKNLVAMRGSDLDDYTQIDEKMKDNVASRHKAAVDVGDICGIGSETKDAQHMQAVPMGNRLPDLGRRIVFLERGHVVHRIQEQMKRKQTLVALQICLLLLAFFWSPVWSRSASPPT